MNIKDVIAQLNASLEMLHDIKKSCEGVERVDVSADDAWQAWLAIEDIKVTSQWLDAEFCKAHRDAALAKGK